MIIFLNPATRPVKTVVAKFFPELCYNSQLSAASLLYQSCLQNMSFEMVIHKMSASALVTILLRLRLLSSKYPHHIKYNLLRNFDRDVLLMRVFDYRLLAWCTAIITVPWRSSFLRHSQQMEHHREPIGCQRQQMHPSSSFYAFMEPLQQLISMHPQQ